MMRVRHPEVNSERIEVDHLFVALVLWGQYLQQTFLKGLQESDDYQDLL